MKLFKNIYYKSNYQPFSEDFDLASSFNCADSDFFSEASGN